jgi:hypothetical protein
MHLLNVKTISETGNYRSKLVPFEAQKNYFQHLKRP